jgi:hypothetical protein
LQPGHFQSLQAASVPLKVVHLHLHAWQKKVVDNNVQGLSSAKIASTWKLHFATDHYSDIRSKRMVRNSNCCRFKIKSERLHVKLILLEYKIKTRAYKLGCRKLQHVTMAAQ